MTAAHLRQSAQRGRKWRQRDAEISSPVTTLLNSFHTPVNGRTRQSDIVRDRLEAFLITAKGIPANAKANGKSRD